jgi:hypothetical protein
MRCAGKGLRTVISGVLWRIDLGAREWMVTIARGQSLTFRFRNSR